MPRPRQPIVPLPKSEIVKLLNDCLGIKGLSRQDLATMLGTRFPKKGQSPRPLNVQTVYNLFSEHGAPMTESQLAKICAVLDYPMEDILARRPYVEPRSLEDLNRRLARALNRIETLERETDMLKALLGGETM